MKKLAGFLLVLLTLTLSVSGCGYSEAELNEAYDRGYDEGYAKGMEDAITPEEQKDSQQEDVSYSKHYIIPTIHIAAASAELGKGEVFEARMIIQKADGSEPVKPPVDGAIIFWIWNSNWRKVVDAGRIQGFYEFSFLVEESGTHTLVFEDEEGECVIYMDYNSPAKLTDASVRQ